MSTRRKLGLFAGALAIVFGVLLGAGGYTFFYAKGHSYLVDNPQACINCHVMNDFYKTWRISSHRGISCNSCHIPESFPADYLVKMEHGLRHAYVFTFEDPQIFRLKDEEVVLNNCVSCHNKVVEPILTAACNDNRCLLCHSGVAHGKR
ncbi:NapC/NirT family cytochrome c [bacterium]|nr:NapC/NirT family cytochrome c [bacterium]MBU1637995.1 NapC/NirT family cytochrome c [bacterium]RQV98853.1 MAG: cytochrome c nitrite reductase small subunit [bacterium]